MGREVGFFLATGFRMGREVSLLTSFFLKNLFFFIIRNVRFTNVSFLVSSFGSGFNRSNDITDNGGCFCFKNIRIVLTILSFFCSFGWKRGSDGNGFLWV